MKKFICIVLICLLLPITSLVLVGCKKDSYDIETFYTTYENITTNTPYLTLADASDTFNLNTTSNKKIVINYTKASNLNAVKSSTPYRYIESLYNQLLDDSLAPVYFFGQKIASSTRLGKDQINQLFEQLKSLEHEYQELDYYIGTLNSSLSATTNTAINLSRLKKVFLQYEKLIGAASSLSSLVSNIYFNTILSVSEFDYSNKQANTLTLADLTKISINTRAKMYYYKSVYANIYHQMFIKNSTISNDITSSNSIQLPSYKPHTYMAGVKSLKSRNYQSLLNISTTMENIYSNSVALFNISQSFESAYAEFNFATSKISYANLNEKSSDEEKLYAKIIERFAYGVATDSYEVLKALAASLYY